MYCPSCGADNAYGLRYCKRCGENLSQASAHGHDPANAKQGEYGLEVEQMEAPVISVRKLSGMFWAIAVFGIVSLIALFGSAIPLMIVSGDRKALMMMFLFGSMGILGIAGMLIRQLSRLIDLVEESSYPRRRTSLPAEQNYPQVAAPPRSVSSVTEHTTRTFGLSAYDEAVGHE